ncbi:endonuclease/exonuclease/phosphatase family protein [Catellatospora vulcania]|uniref:endonuclease/exonuclease/phosphatase family protein n=1 Tax=Catellatospora vulcania TaxID=1460450 RepID=UPI0012D3B4AD|nr:endonuclease/exonuclease/phosphatase family protein [Catellatospora vulcania]
MPSHPAPGAAPSGSLTPERLPSGGVASADAESAEAGLRQGASGTVDAERARRPAGAGLRQGAGGTVSAGAARAASWRRVAVVALLFAVTAESLRACGPLLDQLAGPIGIVNAALVALAVFALPGLLLALRRGPSSTHGVRKAPFLAVTVGVLAVVRIGGGAPYLEPTLVVVALGAVLGLVALAGAVRRFGDPVTVTVGLLAGGVLDLAARSFSVTWDGLWHRGDLTGLLVPAMVLAALALLVLPRAPEVAPAANGRTWALGGYLALWTTTLGNAAFAASQSGVALQLCLAVLIGVLLVAIELVRRLTLHGGTNAIPEPDHWIAGSAALAGMVGGLALAWWGAGPWVLLGIALTQLSAAVAVARAAAAPGNRGDWAYGLVWVLPVLLFQVHYDMPLPFDNRWLLIALAVAVGLAGMGRRPFHPGGWRVELRPLVARPALVTGVVALALVVPALMHATRPTAEPVLASTTELRVLSWNVKYGRDDASGQANPQQLAAAIRAADPDVVVLQEVSRGWAIGGGVDVAEYLSRELGMPFTWSPAADGQFGNLLLTRLPVGSVRTGLLPYGQGPMWRSYLKATLTLHDGRSLDVVTAHLTHRKPNTPTRLAQIDSLLAQVDPAAPTLIAGDFNFWPSWPEQRSFTGAGWVSAQDATGHGAAWTSPTDRPTNRVDWVFGSPQVAFTDFAVLDQVTASDHFPVLATVTLR